MMPIRNRRILLAVTMAGAQRSLQIFVTIITIPLILHALGIAGFGLWAAATSLSWLGAMLDLGLGAALITLVAQGLAAQNITLVRDHITAGLLGTAVMAVLVFCIGGVLVCASVHGAARTAFLIAVGSMALTIPLSLANTIWMGLQKGYVAAGWNIAQGLFNLGGLVGAVFAGAGPLAMVAAFYGSTLLAFAMSLLHLALAHPELQPRRLVLPAAIWREVLAKSLLFAAISIAASLCFVLDNVLALSLLGSLASARMAILLRIGINATGFINALTQPFWPAFADAHGKDDHKWLRQALWAGTAGIMFFCLTGGALLVMFGQPFLHWWLRNSLGVNQFLLWVTAFWIFALSVPNIAGLFFNAIADLKFLLVMSTAANALALALKFGLAAPFGVAGILLAAPVSYMLIMWPASIWRLNSFFKKMPKYNV